jgi:hypothetical protein
MNFKAVLCLCLVSMFTLLLSACGSSEADFGGTWSTNVARLTLTQQGTQVGGLLEGYGDNWRQDVAGTISGNTLTFEGENPLGLRTINLDPGGDTFRSSDPSLAFCGSRASILPAGCGFSGKWYLNAPGLFPSGSYATLQQDGPSVSGSIFDANGATLMRVAAEVNWGKGWSARWQGYIMNMASDEKAFQIGLESAPANEWCGLREGETSAYVSYFTCALQ